ncbi:MAG: c-type cytochrome [Planctomycetaceae bacterium]|nr:c-type cytochrome [Planctomycetaceae bacterium]
MPFRSLALWLVLVALVVPVAAQDSIPRTFTQQPEIAPTVSPEEIAAAKAESPTAGLPSTLFTRGANYEWIWGDDMRKQYTLRKEFAGGSSAARLRATCDNDVVLYLNGQKIGESHEWQQPLEIDVQKYLKDGANVLQAEVANEGGTGGFALKLALTRGDSTEYVVTDGSWQAADKAGKEPLKPAKVVGKGGDKPWNNVLVDAKGSSRGGTDGKFHLQPGFQVERLFTVPKEQLGSWVSITFDNKGRLIASDQGNLGLCRITPPRIGSSEPTKVERLDLKFMNGSKEVPFSGSHGMLYAFDSLYVSINGGPGSGLYRCRDTNGDDQFDEITKLREIRGGGEHGPHSLRLSPDGKSIYIICGNYTQLPDDKTARIPMNWQEDHILPRMWDANGHARGLMAPGGWVAKTDPEGKSWEVASMGYRNPFDFDFNADGEMFAYDADMEWDVGSPWYRPTRVVHATSGSEFGWRSGSGKWPTYYLDSLPELVNIGPGSPVGAVFGYGTKFPAKYQKAFFICDWTFGTMYAIHIEPSGASYRAVKEEFVGRTPLPLTDCAVGPDGALYFSIGGRGTQSELFRVTYVGSEPTTQVDAKNSEGADLRALRRKLEQYHQKSAKGAEVVEFAYPYLNHADRHIRYAARIAIEHQDVSLWQSRVLAEKDPRALITGVVALARQGDKSLQGDLLAALERIKFAELEEFEQLALLRAYQLVFTRTGEPSKEAAPALVAKFDALFPNKNDALNREISQLLIFLQSPTIGHKLVAIMTTGSNQEPPPVIDPVLARNAGYGGTIAKSLGNSVHQQKMFYAFSLRNLKAGWTMEDRKAYFQWLADARQFSGGSSFQGFLRNIDDEAFASATDNERLAIEALKIRKPYQLKELPKPIGPGRDYTLAEIVELGATKLVKRDFKNGQKTFSAARCVVCHRFNGEGGATGPDLTQVAGRFNLKDLTESMTDPSKVISDQYKASTVQTVDGKVYTGKIVSETKESLIIVINPEDSTKTVEVAKKNVDEIVPSTVSLMPKDLLKSLNENEVFDLLAYLLSRGEANHPMFRK